MGTFFDDDHDASIYDVRYVRVQNCGQRDVLGRYCFHFHLKRQCSRCYLRGRVLENKFVNSINLTVFYITISTN